MNPSFRAVLSPCTGVCALDDRGLCEGCHRSAAEIASWPLLDDGQRLRLMEEVLPLRRALHPLDAVPAGPGTNHAELLEFLPDGGRCLRPAAVLVGLVDRGHGRQVLLTRRAARLRHHGGQVSFPGGCMEAGDADPAAAALREAREEIGLQPRQAAPIGYLDPLATITGFHVYPLVARIDGDFTAERDPSEVEEVFELPFSFLMDPANARSREIDFRGSPRRVLEFQFGEYRVWGATAAMLVNLRERLAAHP